MDEKRILITGTNGQLGRALQSLYPHAIALNHSQLDITNVSALERFDWSAVDVIINTAAYTNVDGAETPEGKELADTINHRAVQYLSEVATKHNLTLVHISSDYVFDGSKQIHDETEPFSPINCYGTSKADGDTAAAATPKHYIIRTSWVIGDGKNFVRTMKSLADRGVKPSVVDDQIGRLSFTNTIARGIKHLIDNGAPYGTYNLTNEGDPASWATIAKCVYGHVGANPDDVTPVTTADYYAGKPGIAPRPFQSTLDLTKIKATGFTPTDWRTELTSYLENEPSQEN